MRKVIVAGACSAIAQQVLRIAAEQKKELLLIARSADRLSTLRQDLLARGASRVLTYAADLDDISHYDHLLSFAVQGLPDFDTLLLSYGSMLDQKQTEESAELTARQLHTDLVSAAALLTVFARHFETRNAGGCIAAITSVAGERARRRNYLYGTAKGALSYFLAGLRSRLRKSGVSVLTIKPGPVRTPMTAHMRQSKIFSSPENVAKTIYRALERRSPTVVYAPSYWRYVMAALRRLPQPLFERLVSD